MVAVQALWRKAPLPAGQIRWQQALFGELARGERLSLAIDQQGWQQHLADWGPFPGTCQLVAEPLRNHRQELIGCLLLQRPLNFPAAAVCVLYYLLNLFWTRWRGSGI